MAGEPQPPHSRLSPRLEREIYRINFYRFCQLLEKAASGRIAVGQHPESGGRSGTVSPASGNGLPGQRAENGGI